MALGMCWMFPCLCHASSPACGQSAVVLTGLKGTLSIHIHCGSGGKLNTSGSSWPQPSKDRAATALCPLHIFITLHDGTSSEEEHSPSHCTGTG